MPETFARIASYLLAGAFTWASLAKSVRFHAWRTVLANYGIPEGARPITAVFVPAAELAIAVVIVLVSADLGASLALLALAIFSLAILRARALNGDRLPCGCFGSSNVRDYKTMMLRNALLAVLSSVVLVGDPSVMWPSAPDAGDAVPAALALGGVALIVWAAWQTSTALRRREHH